MRASKQSWIQSLSAPAFPGFCFLSFLRCACAKPALTLARRARRFVPPLSAYTLPIPSAVIFEAQLKIFEQQPGGRQLRAKIMSDPLVQCISAPEITISTQTQSAGDQFKITGDIRGIKMTLISELSVEAFDAHTLLSPILTSQAELDEFHTSISDLCNAVGWKLTPAA